MRSISIFLIALTVTSCATFEPGMRYQDLMRPRQPSAKKVQEGLEVSVEEFASPKKSLQAFDADIALHGVLAFLLRVENNGAETYRIQENAVSVYLGDQSLSSLSGDQAATEGANSEYAGKALGWTVATGPFAILLWPATIAGSAAHTASVNRRIEQHFESMRFSDALLKPNQTAAGFLYFKLPDDRGIVLENLRVVVTPSEELSGRRLSYDFDIPPLDLSRPSSHPAPSDRAEND